jgi:hypothetical protein
MKRESGINSKQEDLFDCGRQPTWQEEWQDMPEFVQENQEPYQTIIIHFETEEDVEGFAKLINQNITCMTKYIYYPKQKTEKWDKLYIDES